MPKEIINGIADESLSCEKKIDMLKIAIDHKYKFTNAQDCTIKKYFINTLENNTLTADTKIKLINTIKGLNIIFDDSDSGLFEIGLLLRQEPPVMVEMLRFIYQGGMYTEKYYQLLIDSFASSSLSVSNKYYILHLLYTEPYGSSDVINYHKSNVGGSVGFYECFPQYISSLEDDDGFQQKCAQSIYEILLKSHDMLLVANSETDYGWPKIFMHWEMFLESESKLANISNRRLEVISDSRDNKQIRFYLDYLKSDETEELYYIDTKCITRFQVFLVDKDNTIAERCVNVLNKTSQRSFCNFFFRGHAAPPSAVMLR